jgi:hypothetical protein
MLQIFCIPNVDLLRVNNEDAPCLRIVSTVLNLLEKSLDCGDVALGLKEVVQHVSC